MTLLITLRWKNGDDETEITSLSPIADVFSITARKGIDVKNNILDFELKNAHGKYVGDDGLIRFKEDDVFELYVKETSDADDINNGGWETSSNLIGSYYLKEYSHLTTLNRHRIKITAVDKAYILFNRVLAQSFGFGSDEYWTSPGIFRSVVRTNSAKDSETLGYIGTDNVTGVRFDIDARFISEGGNITDYRADTVTALNGAISDSDTTITVDSTTGFKDEGTIVINGEHIYYNDTTSTTFTGCVRGIDDTTAEAQVDDKEVYQGFPVVQISKVWKPIYEWLSEMGQPANTNYPDEQTGTLNYDRSFMLWMDKDNRLFFVPTDDSVDTDLVVGSDKLFEVSLEKAVFDSCNMVIYNVGEDMNGAGLNWFWFDQNTNTNDLKMRYQPMIDIMTQLLLDFKNYAADNGISQETTPANDEYRRFPDGSEYSLSSWSFKDEANLWRNYRNKSLWTTLTNDSDFNNSLRDAALWRGLKNAQNITAKVGGLRYRGTVTMKGDYYNPGDLITVTDSASGLNIQKIRVIDVTQNIGKSQWSTNLSVEEDEDALIN